MTTLRLFGACARAASGSFVSFKVAVEPDSADLRSLGTCGHRYSYRRWWAGGRLDNVWLPMKRKSQPWAGGV